MQHLNPVYIIPLLFGHKLQIQLKDIVLQKKSLQIIYFLSRYVHTSPLLKESNILKLPDKISLEKWLFRNKYSNKVLPTIFENWFTLSTDSYTYNARLSNLGCLVVPPHSTLLYGRNSVNISTIFTYFQN